MPDLNLLAVLLRCVIVAAGVAGLASQGGIDEWIVGVLLGWRYGSGFPVVLWVGAMITTLVWPANLVGSAQAS